MGDHEHDEASKISDATREAEAREAEAAHDADRPPTADEERAAPGREDLEPGVAENFEEMAERGATQPGEGQIP